MDNNYAVIAENLNKSYGKRHILKDVSFKISHNEIVGFIGTNGAGKSTTLKYSDKMLEEMDILFIPEGYVDNPINEQIINVLHKAIKNNQEIVSLLKLDKENQHFLF